MLNLKLQPATFFAKIQLKKLWKCSYNGSQDPFLFLSLRQFSAFGRTTKEKKFKQPGS